MKKIFLVIVLIISSFYSKSQQSFLFKEKYFSNETYLRNDTTNTFIEITFSGDKDAVAKIIAQGLVSPTNLINKSYTRLYLTMDSINKDGSIPMEIKYYTKSTSTINNVDKPKSPLTTGDVKALYNNNDEKITVISIDGDTPYDKKRALENLLYVQRIDFPDTPLKIGDTFSHSVPFDYPTQGMDEKIILKSKYTLKTVKGDSVYFDLEQQFNAGVDVKNTSTAVSGIGNGEGSGKIIFSIKEQCIVSNISTLNYRVSVNKLGLELKMKYIIKSAQSMEILPKQSELPPTVKELTPVH